MPKDFTYYANLRPEMAALLPHSGPGRKVLEIGCGEGAFGAALPGAPELWGVEPHAPSAAIAATRFHKVIEETFEGAKAALPENYFDIVICNDVIEHMTDHAAFLRAIQAYMRPGALLLGSVPNVRHYEILFMIMIGKDWEYQDSGVMDRTHLRFFTMRSLRRDLARAGFRILTLKGINSGIKISSRPQTIARSVFALGLIALTLGAARDIRHVQMAFLVSPEP
jgi:2-polyprenyl-3-methyl-5-hydroxy-6-metoxy-1,4-benzoquinol methylase